VAKETQKPRSLIQISDQRNDTPNATGCTRVFFIYICTQIHTCLLHLNLYSDALVFLIIAQDICTSKCLVLRDISISPALYLTNTTAAIHEFLFVAVDATIFFPISLDSINEDLVVAAHI